MIITFSYHIRVQVYYITVLNSSTGMSSFIREKVPLQHNGMATNNSYRNLKKPCWEKVCQTIFVSRDTDRWKKRKKNNRKALHVENYPALFHELAIQITQQKCSIIILYFRWDNEYFRACTKYNEKLQYNHRD